ncbi:hypothetical protein [Oceanimonas marisflavi]|uniref:hypothetical protein n=1 Tax=Oceanimonas marisflavi TaxID=2059724 RepID=UPI000D31EA50|nr:hypothetical protein [Oceanimonas marisflavi]
MRKLIYLSAFFSCSVFAATELDLYSSATEAALDTSRGTGIVQENDSEQDGTIGDTHLNDVITGNNTIAPSAFYNAHGIMMVNLVSGNANITNMSANVNIVSAK